MPVSAEPLPTVNLNALLRNGRVLKLYVCTSTISPVMKGELWFDGKMISRSVRTASSLLTEWYFDVEDDQFSIEILPASGDSDHWIKIESEGEPCYATITAPEAFSRNFILSVLKNILQQMKDEGDFCREDKKQELLLRRVCLTFGWTYQVIYPEITLEL